MIDYISGNLVRVKIVKNEVYVESPLVYEEIPVDFVYVKDCVVTDKFLGGMHIALDSNFVFYIDLATKRIFKHAFTKAPYGLWGYGTKLYVFFEDALWVIEKDIKNVIPLDFRVRGFDLLNPYMFVLLTHNDVPTVSLHSIIELLKFANGERATLMRDDFVSVFYPTEWFDYNNLLFKDGFIWVRGQNGLVKIRLNYIGTYGIVLQVEDFYTTYKSYLESELREQGSKLLYFYRKVNNSVIWYVNQKTGRMVAEVDNDLIFFDDVLVFDRNWAFDLLNKKFYRYAFTAEVYKPNLYKEFYVSFYYDDRAGKKVLAEITYDVLVKYGDMLKMQVLSLLNGQERAWTYKLPLDRKCWVGNIYGEKFAINFYWNDLMKFKINNIVIKEV